QLLGCFQATSTASRLCHDREPLLSCYSRRSNGNVYCDSDERQRFQRYSEPQHVATAPMSRLPNLGLKPDQRPAGSELYRISQAHDLSRFNSRELYRDDLWHKWKLGAFNDSYLYSSATTSAPGLQNLR